MIEISLCSSLPPPQQLPFSLVFVAFFFFPSSSLLFPSVVGCQPGPRRKSKLKRQMRAVTSQGWGGTERAARPPAPCPGGGGTARSPWHAGAMGAMLISAAQKKNLYFVQRKIPFPSLWCFAGVAAGQQNVFQLALRRQCGHSVWHGIYPGEIPAGGWDSRWRKAQGTRQWRQTMCLVSRTGSGAGEARIIAATAC